MTLTVQTPCTAFAGHRRLAAGPLADVALAVKAALEDAPAGQHGHVLTFDDITGRVVDIDIRGSREDVLARLARAHAAMEAAAVDASAREATGPVPAADSVAAPVAGTAIPTGAAPATPAGDASVPPASDAPVSNAPRSRGRPRLGVVAREVTLLPRHWEWLNAQPGGASVALRKLVESGMRDRRARERGMREAAYRFMSAMAGDMAGFEEAARTLFADDARAMSRHMASWPADIREHALRLAFGQ